jgi:polyisoprenoid-binding protein YceI
MKKIISLVLLSALASFSYGADYKIDTEGTHAFIQFKIKHLGYSWLYGRFNQFDGTFSWTKSNPESSKVSVNIDMNSLDTNHVERDKHLKDERFFDVKAFPKASFVSTSFKMVDEGSAELVGNLTLRGVTKSIAIAVDLVGQGPDPWGGVRAGFTGKAEVVLADFGIDSTILGPSSSKAELMLDIEGIKI